MTRSSTVANHPNHAAVTEAALKVNMLDPIIMKTIIYRSETP